jgi:hypothetical protein
VDRRAFLGTLAGGLLAASLAAVAQPPRKVAFLAPISSSGNFRKSIQVTQTSRMRSHSGKDSPSRAGLSVATPRSR